MEENINENNKQTDEQSKKTLLEKIIQTNLLPLAFIGDSVHTLFAREYVLKNSPLKMDNYNTLASKFCKASTQSSVLKELMPTLNEEELEIVRRGRNAKPKHHAKNATLSDYSYATAFEVLIGYLYLKEDNNRLKEILDFSVQGYEQIVKPK